MNDNRTEFKKALLISAFFIACLPRFTAAAPLDCKLAGPSETANIRYVHDGDTVILSDDRHIRLIGIDTPELARNNHQADAYAIEARDAVRQLLKQKGNNVQLYYGAERLDRYGRTLAHILLSDNSLIQSRLLQQGLAVAYTTPPNSRLTTCYQQHEHLARGEKRNIWSYEKYQPVESTQLSRDMDGFRIVRGTLMRIGKSKKAIWLNLDGNFAARIAKTSLPNFTQIEFRNWLNSRLEIRGWLKHYDGKFHISVRHPAAIRQLEK